MDHLTARTRVRGIPPQKYATAKILGVDDAGAAVKFQSHAFEVAQYRLRKQVDAQDVREA